MTAEQNEAPAGPLGEERLARVTVPLRGRAYDILIGHGLLADLPTLLGPAITAHRLAVVSDARVFALYGDRLRKILKEKARPALFLEVPPGDTSKNFHQLERLCNALLEAGIARDDYVIAFGGGMVGDLAGLAASLVRRGVGLIQIPTTLLAQVDSAVGGKTAINTPSGKNLIGSFHQPRLVVSDLALLSTLSARERRAGLAEVAKYGVIAGPEFWGWLTSGGLAAMDRLAKDALVHGVAASCRIKADIVAADEREESGRRFLLNLGHTFAHALEAAAGFDSSRLLHGEAVAIGLVLAARLAAALGEADPALADEQAALLRGIGLPVSIDEAFKTARPAADRLIAAMQQDKKMRGGRLRFVLPRRVGDVVVRADVPEHQLRRVLVEAGCAA